MARSDTYFKKGNTARAVNPKVVVRKFIEMAEKAMTDENILCFEDACNAVGWRSTKIYYWVKKSTVFEIYKKEIQSIIIRRINKKGLKGEYNPTMSIWRLKMLGENEVIETIQKHEVKNIEPPKIEIG